MVIRRVYQYERQWLFIMFDIRNISALSGSNAKEEKVI